MHAHSAPAAREAGARLLSELSSLIDLERRWMMQLDSWLLDDGTAFPVSEESRLFRARRSLQTCIAELRTYQAMRARSEGGRLAVGAAPLGAGLRLLRLELFALRRRASRLLHRAIATRHHQVSGALRGLALAHEEAWQALTGLSDRRQVPRARHPYAA